MSNSPKHAIVMGGSRGVGAAIAAALAATGCEVIAASRNDVDTSSLASVSDFALKHPATDVLVLNTGGPPKKSFEQIALEDFETAHRQLFLSMALLLQRVTVRDGGYIFLVGSHLTKEPNDTMVLSEAYRSATWAMLKGLTKRLAARQVSCINLALGPVLTDRLRALTADLPAFEARLPMKRAGRPEEIGAFVRSIVEHEIKYLSGVSITFDGGAAGGIY